MQFDHVSVIKKANIYFDGQVTSRAVLFENGEKKTLGIMMPGEYEFGTDKKEIMEILGGSMKVLLPHSEEWIDVNEGDSFEVPAKSKFNLKITEVTDYCCSYVD
jgi:uncharacterized protein YaiE (UPF0345 family)